MESVSTAVAGASSGEHGWEQSWEHGQAIVNGVRLHYVAAGAGPVVLLLHGFPECWYTWRRQIPALAAAGFRVVAPDMRGYNTSEKPPGVGGYMIEALVGDALGLIQCFGDGRATVVGHDWGGYIAWHVAMAHPEAVAGLAVLNGPHPAVFWREVRRPAQALRSWYQVFFQLPWLPEAILCAGEYALLKRPFRRDPIRPGAYTEAAIQRNVAAMAQPGALSAALNYYRATWRHGWRQTLREMRVVEGPVLVIWGERDRYLSLRLTRGLERWAPGVRVERIAGASHWVQHDDPQRVNELLLGLLRRVSGQGAGNGGDRDREP